MVEARVLIGKQLVVDSDDPDWKNAHKNNAHNAYTRYDYGTIQKLGFDSIYLPQTKLWYMDKAAKGPEWVVYNPDQVMILKEPEKIE